MSRQPPAKRSPSAAADQLAACELASYIAEMSGELAVLARRAEWPLIAYFLEMAQMQAGERLREHMTPPPVFRDGANERTFGR